MTQVRFTIGDADHLRQSGAILKAIREQIAAAVKNDPSDRLPAGAYGALSVLADMEHKLANWAVALETKAWEKILERKSK